MQFDGSGAQTGHGDGGEYSVGLTAAIRSPTSADTPLVTSGTPQVETLRVAQGMPAALLATFDDSDSVHHGVSGGNPESGRRLRTRSRWVVGHDFKNTWATR